MGSSEAVAAFAARVERFRRTGDPAALFDGDVEAELWSLPDSAEDDSARETLATLFLLRFEHRSEVVDLACALAFHWPGPADQVLLRRLLPGREANPETRFGAAVAFAAHEDHPIALRMAIVLAEQLVADTRHRDHALHASLLVTLNFAVYRQSRDLRAVDEWLDRARAALAVLRRRDPDRGWFQAAIAVGLGARVEAGGIGELGEAIETGEQALTAPERRARGRFRLRRFHHPFERVLDDYAASYELPGLRIALMDVLGRAYFTRYLFARSTADLGRSVELHRASGSPGLARAALARFDLAGDVADLHLAAGAAHLDPEVADYAALAGFAASLDRIDPELPGYRLGGLLRRLWLAHDTADLDARIAVGELALAVNGVAFRLAETPLPINPDDPVRDVFVARLADVYRTRFEASGAPDDLRRAAELAAQVGEESRAVELDGDAPR